MKETELNKYPKYKPSGVEWIGEIPDEWDVIKLKYALDSLESGSRETGGGSIAEGIFSIGGEHIGWLGELLLENPKYVSEDYYNNLENGKIIEDDVLLVKDGATIGKCSIVKSLPFEKCAVNEHVFILRANKKFSADFIFNFIWCRIGQEQILLNVRGSAQPGLNSQFKNDVLISVPPKSEQTAIANYLDDKTAKIDTLIEKKKKLIELLKEERTAVINYYVLGQHLIDNGQNLIDNGQLTIDNSQLSIMNYQLPKHWEVKKLKYVCKFEYGESLSSDQRENGNIPVFGSNGITGFHSISISKAPCIIVGRKGSFGKINWSDQECFPIDTTYFIDIDRTKENLRFIYFLLITLHLDKISKDTGVPGLNREDAYSNYVAVPPITEQHQIVQHIETETKRIDGTISKIEKEIELLQEYRTALISEVVTGKIKVIDN